MKSPAATQMHILVFPPTCLFACFLQSTQKVRFYAVIANVVPVFRLLSCLIAVSFQCLCRDGPCFLSDLKCNIHTNTNTSTYFLFCNSGEIQGHLFARYLYNFYFELLCISIVNIINFFPHLALFLG